MAVNNHEEIYVDSHTREIQENTRKLRYIYEVHKEEIKFRLFRKILFYNRLKRAWGTESLVDKLE